MITINHECYVSLEVAKLLKEAGFDWETFGYYNKLGFFHRAVPQHDELKAPTLDVAQRWLREVNDVDIIVHVDYHYGEYYSKSYCGTFYIGDELYTTEHFNTYELVLEAGIKKALEIILEEGD